MLSVVTFKWREVPGYRSKFTGQHVNILRNMVARNYRDPHRFICITDDPEGIDPRIEVVPLWDDHRQIKNPTWPHGPHCFPRLKVFSREFRAIAGERFVCLDLDLVITDDLRPLWNRPEEFVIFSSLELKKFYNGSMFLMTAGARAQVWEQFDPMNSPRLAKQAGYRGSDQAWINYCLGPGEASWTWSDGVYPYPAFVVRKLRGGLPHDARVIVFWGRPDPWSKDAQILSPWIRNYYY